MSNQAEAYFEDQRETPFAVLRRVWPVLLAASLFVLFETLPEIDLWFSGLFYDDQAGFFLDQAWPVQLSYQTFKWMPYVVLPGLLLATLYAWTQLGDDWSKRNRIGLFLLLTLLLGPGLLVNEVVKRESGRARPATVEQFHGDRHFTSPFTRAQQCESNCSFVSGHASMGFFFLAFAWVFGHRKWLYFGALIGGLVGLGRVVQGAHFLSDVLFGFALVYLTALVCARVVLGRWRVESDSE